MCYDIQLSLYNPLSLSSANGRRNHNLHPRFSFSVLLTFLFWPCERERTKLRAASQKLYQHNETDRASRPTRPVSNTWQPRSDSP